MMLHRGLIIVWRLLIFVVMALLAFITSFYAFPFIGHHTSLLPAVLLSYCLLAYFVIPVGSRLLRLAIKPNHIPTYVTTGDGWPSDPVNIALTVRNRRHLVRALEGAGWHKADKSSIGNSLKMTYAFLTDTAYPDAPCSNLYMFGRSQDIAFEIPIGNSPRVRHHVRFWRVDPITPGAKQHLFWWQTLRSMVGKDRELWVGAATFDKHLGLRWRSLQVTHQIDADTDKERDYLIQSLRITNYVRSVRDVKAGEPYKFRGQNFGVNITNDGYVKLCELKRPLSLYLTKATKNG